MRSTNPAFLCFDDVSDRIVLVVHTDVSPKAGKQSFAGFKVFFGFPTSYRDGLGSDR